MDKWDIVNSLKEMFDKEQKNTESDYVIESKQIDQNKYLTLIKKDKDEFIITDPDYEAFINLLKYHNTKNLNYVAAKLNDNKAKIFNEFSKEEREKLMNTIKDFYTRLSNSNVRNLPFVELLIVDWVDKLF